MRLKRAISIMIAVLIALTPVCVLADGNADRELPEYLFVDAINALHYMSEGNYKDALDTLQLADSSVTADDLAFFVQTGFNSLSGGVQCSQALACYSAAYGWVVAVPLWEPNAMDVETFILHSSDGYTYDRYNATTWAFIDKLMTQSEVIIYYSTDSNGRKYIVAD